MNRIILWVLVIVVGIAAVLFYPKQTDRRQDLPQPSQPPSQPEESTIPQASGQPEIRFPVSEVSPPVADQEKEQQPEPAMPLPPLDESDDEISTALAGLMGQDKLMDLFRVKEMIRHIVVTIDNLPRKQYAVKYLPTKPVAGSFTVTGNNDDIFLSIANYQRYTPYVRLMETLDEKRVVALYSRFYPLFQQAYDDLGYPSRYFNDRLVEVIDQILETPEVQHLIRLVQPNVLYEYADEDLQELSAGQKVLIRMGNDNAMRVKEVLRKYRRQLTAHAGDKPDDD